MYAYQKTDSSLEPQASNGTLLSSALKGDSFCPDSGRKHVAKRLLQVNYYKPTLSSFSCQGDELLSRQMGTTADGML